ncbi:bifunctional UDP-N-acetylmuramoyl-tripeptide:D-alanyl-D-alanine ligase/alanine racemase [Marinoscillum sp.]|uniref:bifunctional UDP-N-acetylmuramoyl-tripeptide:D-alanyl-D-alanine ligase/alanine racemase n=1 Tax=Marinoscillum sp. TaxID=2024838 RepID=UPI003BAA2472
MHISQIATIVNGRLLQSSDDLEIQTIVYDSRKATGAPDELFIALPGSNHDGHDYVEPLIRKGVRNFLISKSIAPSQASLNIIRVEHVLESLQQLAAYHRRQFQLPVVGITGSNGKTIVKEWLSTLLSHQFQVVKSPKSFNSQLGVPLSVLSILPHHEVGVFEAGVSKTGEMTRLAPIIQPQLGIFTNIGEAHAEGFKSLSAKLEEKAKLFENCQRVICKYQHSAVKEELEKHAFELITWGINTPEASINYHQAGNQYTTSLPGQNFTLEVSWQNEQDQENLFHSITAAIVLQEDNAHIQKGIADLRPVPMRLELKRGRNSTHILDDSYNNDLLGLQVALDYLKQQPHKQRKTVIISDILQSGKEPKILYSRVNELLKNHAIDRVIGIGPDLVAHNALFSRAFEYYEDVFSFLKTAPDFNNEIILVKGARNFGLEKVVAYLEEKSHGTVLEVNFEAITHNLNLYRSRLSPNTRLMVMVKAFAYGVGVEEISHLLQYHQVDYLGVAYLDEAINLRRKGIQLPIMIMNVDWDSLGLLSAFNLEPEIYSLSMLQKLLDEEETPPPVHIKIETGMNRLGFDTEAIDSLIDLLSRNPQVKVAGIFTHFSSSDNANEDAFTRHQAALFDVAYRRLADHLGYSPIKHAVNSAGIVRWPNYHYDMVRLGIGLYGFDSSAELDGLKPISQLKTKISQIKQVKAGESIGYSRMGKAKRDSLIATIALGYADGYTRLFGNGQAYVMVNGQQAPTIGNVCMDMTMIDVTGIEASEGDEVIVFGQQPTIEELAQWSQTIPYEILTNVSQRVKRVFVSE